MCSNLKKARTEAFCWYIPKAMSLSINSYLINLSENPQSKIGNAEINGFIKKKPSFFLYESLLCIWQRNKWYCSTYELSQDSRLVTNSIWQFSWCWKGAKLPPPWSRGVFRSFRQLQSPEGSFFLIFNHS